MPRLGVLFAHFVVYDRVPGCPAFVAGDIMFARPSPQPEFFDQIQLRQSAASHNPFLNNEVHHPLIVRMEHNRYIGPTAKFKEFFVFSHQKSPASRVKLILYQVYAEISETAKFDKPAAQPKGSVDVDGNPAGAAASICSHNAQQMASRA